MPSSTHGSRRRGLFALVFLSAAVAGACGKDSVTPNRPPETPTIASPQSGTSFPPGEAVQFQGSANDPEDGPLSGVRLSWSSNVDGQLGTGPSITVDDLSESAHTITLRATDSGGLTSTATVSIQVVNAAPVPQITSPDDGDTFSPGDDIDFEGSANDVEDGALTGSALVWSSSRDGELGTGGSISTDDLSEGVHTVTLTATDSNGKTGSATISVTVADQAPTANITEPDDGDSAALGAVVQFRGTGSDPEDGNLTGGDLVWTSSIDGQIGTGTSFNRSNLSLGEHEITLTATDSNGATGSASVDLTIQGAPAVTITAPLAGATFPVGAAITFTGSATDPEDGPIVGSSLVWTSDLDGQIGTAESFATAALSEGDHTITLRATDSDGLTGTATVEIAVQTASAPTASITSPANGASFPAGAQVIFLGSATDPEDGDLTGGSLVWLSDLDGQIGTGTSFVRSTLSIGTHTITLRATDTTSRSGTAVISITITGPPAVTITSPAEGASFSAGGPVTFTGSATDPEDGPLTGGSLVWRSSRDGQIGTGETFQSTTLTQGTHIISLTATDSEGLTGTAQRTITINPPGSPPTVTITEPTDGGSALQGTSVTFSSSVTDTEDGVITGASLTWTSSRDGFLTNGASFSTTSLSVGTHTITLEAIDSDGWVVTDEITYTITTPSDPIQVQVGSAASSSIAVNGTTTLPIMVDMSNAGGRDVAAIQIKLTWNTSVATYDGHTDQIGTVNSGNAGAGELIVFWFGATGRTSTFHLADVEFRGAGTGGTTITITVETITDEEANSLAGDTGTRNHTLTVN